VSVADPFCPVLSDVLYRAIKEAGAPVHRGGNFVTVSGPRFSTKAESRVFRAWGMDIIGMTTSPEAFLAREAEMSYAVMAHVTDYDVWHESEEPVTVDRVVQTLLRNADVAKQAVTNAIRNLVDVGPSPYADALRDAIITNKGRVQPETVARLAQLIAKYF
jgi:5'-methylthioadenosine phosphorylase